MSFRPYDNETCSEKEYSFNRIVNLATLAKKKKRKEKKTKLWKYTVKQCQKKSPIQGKFYTWCLSHGAEVRVYFAVCLIYQNLNFTINFFFSKVFYWHIMEISYKILCCCKQNIVHLLLNIFFSFWFGFNIFL